MARAGKKPEPSPFAHGKSEIWERPALTRAIASEKKKLGQRLRALRIERGLTQQQAAEEIGVHHNHVVRIEGGSANVTLPTLVAFAVAYRVELRFLFG